MDKTRYLYLNSRDEFLRIDIFKIAYLESDGNYTNIILERNIKATVSMNLSQMQSVLGGVLKENAGMFARIGKRHIVNLRYVYRIAILRQRLVLYDGTETEHCLSVSKEALKNLRDMFVSGQSER